MSVFVDTLVSPVIEGIEENCTDNQEKWNVLDRVISQLQGYLADWEEPQGDAIDRARAALDAATGKSYDAQQASVVAAVKFAALIVRHIFPDAKTIEFEDSDQGDWLSPYAIDGYRENVDNRHLTNDLEWAASCIYDAHRDAAEGMGLKTRAEGRTLTRSSGDDLYIDIEEALR
jgi:hypothetical protein